MKIAILSFALLVITLTGSINDGACLICPDSIPKEIKQKDTALIMQIYREESKPLIDSVVRETAEKVEKTKLVQDSLSIVVDSIYQQTFKKEFTGKVDTWPYLDKNNIQHIATYIHKYYLFPNGIILYHKTINKKRKK